MPAGYAQDCIEALVRDPRWLFVYWELGGAGHQQARQRHGEAGLAEGKWVLRVEHCSAACAEPRCFDVPVDPGAGNWYLQVAPLTTYRVRIGVVLPSGFFVELAASRSVATPAESVSDRADEEWMIAWERFQELVSRTLWRGLAGSSGMSQLRAAEVRRGMALFPAGISSLQRR